MLDGIKRRREEILKDIAKDAEATNNLEPLSTQFESWITNQLDKGA